MQTGNPSKTIDLGRLRLHSAALLAEMFCLGSLLFPWNGFAQLLAYYKALASLFFVLVLLALALVGYFVWRAICEESVTLWETYSPFYYSVIAILQLVFGYLYLLPLHPMATLYMLGALGLFCGTFIFARQSWALSSLLQGRALAHRLATAGGITLVGLIATVLLGGAPRSHLLSVPPTAKFVVLSSMLRVGEPIEFDATESQATWGKITKYDWDFGDGVWYEADAPSGARSTHVYYEQGQYEVMLRVSDDHENVSAAYILPITVAASESGLETRQLLQGQVVSGMAWDGHALWTVDRQERSVYVRYVRADEEWVRYDLPEEIRSPSAIEWSGQYMWVTDDLDMRIFKLSFAKALAILSVFEYPGVIPADMAWDGKYLWVIDEIDAMLYALDPENGGVQRTLKLDQNLFPRPLGLAWDGLAFWVSDMHYGIRRIHPNNGAILGTIAGPDGNRYPVALAWDSGSQGYGTLLVADQDTRQLYRLRLRAWGTEKTRGGAGPMP